MKFVLLSHAIELPIQSTHNLRPNNQQSKLLSFMAYATAVKNKNTPFQNHLILINPTSNLDYSQNTQNYCIHQKKTVSKIV